FRGIFTLEDKVIAARIHFGERRVTGTETAMIVLDTREAFAGAALNVDVPGKGTMIVVLQVRGMCGNRASFNRKYLAADIIAVQEPPTKQVFHKPGHEKEMMMTQRLQSLANSTHASTQQAMAARQK